MVPFPRYSGNPQNRPLGWPQERIPVPKTESKKRSPVETWLASVPLLQSGYHQKLLQKIDRRRKKKTIYPSPDRVFCALELTSFPDVKVVILGQDPYHGEGQAHGLAFSVPADVYPPPSLKNIFREIQADVYRGESRESSPDLTRWALQGVLLLNAVLTVEEGKPGSHQGLGWKELTDQIIETLSASRENLVFMLWGAHARSKRACIDPSRHLVLEAGHPSPLSAHRGFFGCRHFSRTNQYLEKRGIEPIQW